MITNFLRALFYWPIRLTASCQPIPFEPLKHIKLDPKKEIAYIMVSSSVGNMLTVERLTNRLGWPSPFGTFKLGDKTIPRTAHLRHPAFFTSNAKQCDVSEILYKWFEACHSANTDLQVIPITVLWSRDPGIEGQAMHGIDSPTPIWRKFLTLTFAGRDNCTIISNPFSAMLVEKRLLKISDEQQRRKTMQRLVSQHFEKKARAIVGEPFPDRDKLLQELVQRPGTQRAIAEQMEATGESKEALEKKAFDIFNVMAADTRYPLLRFFNCIISMVWNRIYHGQSIIGADKVRDLVQSGHEIIYIPCHRSHMDYILLLFAIFHEGLPIPQVASGDNLNFFPVGGIIRRCGSYFIRRKMKGDALYTALFREYLSVLFERGYATEFFIEGGRSRTGRTLPPRTGMVSMTVQAQLRGIERPIVFIPTYLGYEHVMEVGSYMHELDGAKKKKESISDLLGIFKRLRYYGRGYVTFGDPISVPKFLNSMVPNWYKDIDPTGVARPDWLYDTVNQLSHQIIINLNDSATVNGINLCALALIADADHTMSINMLKRCLKLYLIILNCDESRKHLLPTSSIDTLISQALELNKFHVYDVGEDMKFVRPSRGQTLQLTYFQNNILHLFALPALVANILLRNGHINRHRVISYTRSLFYFLRHELFAPVSESELDDLINKYLDVFVQGGYILQQEDNMLTLSGDGYEEMLILSASIRLNLIRYLIAVTVLRQIQDGFVTKDEFVKLCVELCHHVPSEVTNNSPEFADPIMFNIMCETFMRHHYFSILENGTLSTNPPKIKKLAHATSPLLSAALVRQLNSEVVDIKQAQAELKVEQDTAEAERLKVEAEKAEAESERLKAEAAKSAAATEQLKAEAEQAAAKAEHTAAVAEAELSGAATTEPAAEPSEPKTEIGAEHQSGTGSTSEESPVEEHVTSDQAEADKAEAERLKAKAEQAEAETVRLKAEAEKAVAKTEQLKAEAKQAAAKAEQTKTVAAEQAKHIEEAKADAQAQEAKANEAKATQAAADDTAPAKDAGDEAEAETEAKAEKAEPSKSKSEQGDK